MIEYNKDDLLNFASYIRQIDIHMLDGLEPIKNYFNGWQETLNKYEFSNGCSKFTIKALSLNDAKSKLYLKVHDLSEWSLIKLL